MVTAVHLDFLNNIHILSLPNESCFCDKLVNFLSFNSLLAVSSEGTHVAWHYEHSCKPHSRGLSSQPKSSMMEDESLGVNVHVSGLREHPAEDLANSLSFGLFGEHSSSSKQRKAAQPAKSASEEKEEALHFKVQFCDAKPMTIACGEGLQTIGWLIQVASQRNAERQKPHGRLRHHDSMARGEPSPAPYRLVAHKRGNSTQTLNKKARILDCLTRGDTIVITCRDDAFPHKIGFENDVQKKISQESVRTARSTKKTLSSTDDHILERKISG